MAMAVAESARAVKKGTKLWAYYALTKPRVTATVALSMVAGHILALPRGVHDLLAWDVAARFVATLVGTILVSAGSAALNHSVEWTTDQLMPRTRNRPIPAGILTPRQGLLWGAILCGLGLGILLFVDFLVLLLATLTVVAYIVVYTPMKRCSPYALLVGAIPGALPAAGGWIAASGVGLGAALVFLVLYWWQLPHFLALSWLYRKDYAQAGFPVAAVAQEDGRRVGWYLLLSSAALLGSGVLVGISLELSPAFVAGMAVLGGWLVGMAALFWRSPGFERARHVLRSAYVYLLGFVALTLLARP